MPLPDPQRSQVVLIGTSRYEDEELPALPAVARSISDLAAALTGLPDGLVPKSHCTVLADEGDIRLIGRQLRLAARRAEDLLLVYFVGHGLVSGWRHDLYLALPESELPDPEFNSLEYDKLRSAVRDSPASTKIIILDCCFSGRVVTDTMTDPVSHAIGQVEVEGTYVLTSAPRDKVSLIIPGEDHTAFTGRFLKLLRDGIFGGSEFLTIDDLYRQLVVIMQAEGLPRPQKRGTDSAGLLALARNRAYAPANRPPPTPEMQAEGLPRPQKRGTDSAGLLAPARNRAYAPANRPPPTPEQPITPEDALAELDAMVGLGPVKEQVHSIYVSIEAARRRAEAGFGADKPMRHFVFLGPPGTGKTTVARVIGKIFYAFGLLESADVVEAQRSDLVGEYLGATAIKTNELVDSALGRVLFIDEAYSLVNEGDGQSDRFGAEAVQTLLKRAEDDREHLIIILAGYQKQTQLFLATNPGLASRFATRIRFPTYSTVELLALAEVQLLGKQELLAPDARPALWGMLEEVGRRRITDELGNGRFVRTLLEKAGQARDVRVMSEGDPGAEDLLTIAAVDLGKAFAELTSRQRGYGDIPTLASSIAELDELVGLEPVKQQVRVIAAQLRVAKLRDRQGLTSQPPVRHFVFTGPPGTGKTTVAMILGRIFAALGLLVSPEVVEAHRSDLVGEHLGSTAIKTDRLVDSALGGVLFIDEAYSLHNEGYPGGDSLGAEAVQTLLRRAIKDRGRLVIILSGYTAEMNRFMRTTPGLASTFRTRVEFPSYTGQDLSRIAVLLAEQAGDAFDPSALLVLDSIFARTAESGRVDELGNGRFAQSLFERACSYRDVRVVQLGENATAADLTTVTAIDVRNAFQELAVDRSGEADLQGN